MVSQRLGGRYQILQPLGGGGFGQTYLAEDWHLPGHPLCVVKQLKPEIDGESLDSARRLFDAEANALYQLGTHPCIPQLLAHFEEAEQFYLVQEYIQGTLLSDELQTAPWPETQVLELLIDVLRTLSFVHDQKAIHRDIKPSNLIRRERDGQIVLIDFGSVKQVSAKPIEQKGSVSVTIAIGSMGYMPNEQLAGEPCLSSDIYAVGMLGLQALSGSDPRRLRKDPRTGEIIWPRLVDVSDGFRTILERMIRYDYRQRFPNATQALQALQTLVAPEGSLERQMFSTNGSLRNVHFVWLERADEYFQVSRYGEAISAYEHFLQMQPSHDQAWFKLGLAYESLEHYEEAMSSYDCVLQLQPQDYLAWLKRAKVLEALNRQDEALAAYEEALRLQPENYWIWCDQALVLQKLNCPEEALASFDRAIQLKPDFKHALDCRKLMLLMLRRADQLYQLQHYAEAVAACQQVIQDYPEDTSAWLMQAMALENLGKLQEAIVAYGRVVRLQPDDTVAWSKLAGVLDKLRLYKQAAMAYSQVIRIEPTNYWAWFHRGQMLEQLRRYQKAMAAYNQAIQLKPDLRPALEARQKLMDHILFGHSSQKDGTAHQSIRHEHFRHEH